MLNIDLTIKPSSDECRTGAKSGMDRFDWMGRMKKRFKCGHQPCLSREERRKAKGIKTVLVLWPSLDDDAIGALDPMLLTIRPFPLLAISNGDILCFVKIPSFDGDIFSFAHSFPDMGRSHTTTEDFFSIEIFICTPGHSSAVFLLCGAFVQYIG